MANIHPVLSQKIKEINIILTILIVWLHVSANYNIPQGLINISILSVPCFFAISSFLYFMSFDFQSPIESYKKKISSRFKSLLIPFILFNLFGFVFSILAQMAIPENVSPLEGLDLKNVWGYFWRSEPNGPLWYLRSLFIYF